MSRRIKDHGREFAIEDLAQLTRRVGTRLDGRGNAEVFAAEIQSRFTYVHHRETGAGRRCKLNHAQTDGSGADDQNPVVRPHTGTFDGVSADAERFHKSELIEREKRRRVQLRRGNADERPHASIDVNAKNLKALAAVRFSPQTGDALAAIEIGFDRATVADGKAAGVLAHGNNLDAEFVAENPRIFKKRLPAMKCVEVGPTNADAVHSDDCVPGSGRGLGRFAGNEKAGFCQSYMFHDGSGRRGFQAIDAVGWRQWRIHHRELARIRD